MCYTCVNPGTHPCLFFGFFLFDFFSNVYFFPLSPLFHFSHSSFSWFSSSSLLSNAFPISPWKLFFFPQCTALCVSFHRTHCYQSLHRCIIHGGWARRKDLLLASLQKNWKKNGAEKMHASAGRYIKDVKFSPFHIPWVVVYRCIIVMFHVCTFIIPRLLCLCRENHTQWSTRLQEKRHG